MAGGQIIGAIFFLCVTFAGLTSLINLYEAPISYVQERFRRSRAASSLVVIVLGCAVGLCIQAIVSQWMDAVSIYVCPLGALLAPTGKYVYCALAIVALVAGALLGGIG